MRKKTNSIFSAFLIVVVLSLNLPSCATQPRFMEGEPLPTLAPMLERVTPAVVNVSTEGRIKLRSNPLLDDPFFKRFFDLPDLPKERSIESLGSGVVIDAQKGYIVTNHHVIDRADSIMVTLRDGSRFKAKVIGSDPETDVAVIQISASHLAALPLADSDQLRVGDFVVAIGNPFGLGQTATSGIVSALGRSGLGIEGYEDFIQTDASINPGNSGGPLVNLRGEMVGINTAILAPTGGNVGIGFAIPANMVKHLMDQLITHGEVRRGRLGVTVQDLTAELADAFHIPRNQGALIAQVIPNSAAERAGLKAGDVIFAVNGREIRDAGSLRNAIGLLPIGQPATLNILRDSKIMTVTVTIGEFKPSTAKVEKIHQRFDPRKLQNAGPAQAMRSLFVALFAT